MARGSVLPQHLFVDPPELSAATMLALTSGKYDWLNSKYVSLFIWPLYAPLIYVCRYVDSNWDLGEVEKDWKEKIIRSDALVNRLALP
jgi:hypothetical protein